MVLALVLITHSITGLPEEFRTAIEIVSSCTSNPIYFTLVSIQGVLSGAVELNTQNPTPKGAPFNIASGNRTCSVSRLIGTDVAKCLELP